METLTIGGVGMKFILFSFLVAMSLFFWNPGHAIIGPDPHYVDDEADFPAVVKISNNCPATKVGARLFITAAHCLQAAPEIFRPGATIDLSAQNHVDGKQWLNLTLSEVYIHPSFVAIPELLYFYKNSFGMARYSFDLGLLYVEETTPQIGMVFINFDPVEDGEPLVFLGYGCQDGLNQPVDLNRVLRPRLQMGFSIAAPYEGIHPQKEEDFMNDFYLHFLKTPWEQQRIYFYNIISRGHDFDSRYSGLCPGDSGGPVFREGRYDEIVGINAYYSFKNGNDIPYSNWHTRLSQAAPWIQSIFDEINDRENRP